MRIIFVICIDIDTIQISTRTFPCCSSPNFIQDSLLIYYLRVLCSTCQVGRDYTKLLYM